MHTKLPFDPEARLEVVTHAFEQWRNTRKKRERIPDDLWQAAAELVPYYSTFKIAKILRLDFKEFKRRISVCIPNQPTACQFVELKVEQLFDSAPCRFRLRSPTGFELEIESQGDLPSPIYHIMSCFLKESR